MMCSTFITNPKHDTLKLMHLSDQSILHTLPETHICTSTLGLKRKLRKYFK